MMKNSFYMELPDINATQRLAISLASSLYPGAIIYLHGALGAGKTTFVRSILYALGYNGIIKSPSFSLVEEYTLNNLNIYHFDLYRLATSYELEFIGIRDYMSNNTSIFFFEWAYKGSGNIPIADLEITLNFHNIKKRKILLLANNTFGIKILSNLVI